MDIILKELEKAITAAFAGLHQEAGTIRTNRPSPALVEDLKIDYQGTQLAIKQLGSISIVPPRELVITLWDPSGVTQVAKAIEDSKRGFNPAVRGASIHINLPALTQERRDELIKLLKTVIEKTKIRVRMLRDDANKRMKAGIDAKTITETQKTVAVKKIQELIDKSNKEIEVLLEKKIKEINE